MYESTILIKSHTISKAAQRTSICDKENNTVRYSIVHKYHTIFWADHYSYMKNLFSIPDRIIQMTVTYIAITVNITAVLPHNKAL